eukprot:361886-Amphidinium_carterae.1
MNAKDNSILMGFLCKQGVSLVKRVLVCEEDAKGFVRGGRSTPKHAPSNGRRPKDEDQNGAKKSVKSTDLGDPFLCVSEKFAR